MNKAYFEILRAGVNTTIQDKGRNHLYHIGIAVSGAIDQRNYILSNKLVEGYTLSKAKTVEILINHYIDKYAKTNKGSACNGEKEVQTI